MKKLSTRRIAALGASAVLGAGIASQLVAPPVANAQPNTVTVITWQGTDCINHVSTNVYNAAVLSEYVICGGSWTFSEGNIWPGDYFGSDPIMGNATHIECALFVNGYVVYADVADAGDGTDVNCLRIAAI